MPNLPLFERPLEKLLPQAEQKRIAVARKIVQRDRNPDDLFALAKLQSRSMLLAIFTLLFLVGSGVGLFFLNRIEHDELLMWVLAVGCGIAAVVLLATLFYTVMKLSTAVFESGGVALMVLMSLAGGLFLAAIVVHFFANEVLNRNGIRSGLFGAKRAALREINPAVRHENQLPVLGW